MQLSIFVSLCFRKSFGLLNEYMTIWLLRNQVFLIFASPRPFSSELGQLGIIYPFPFRVVGSNGLGPSTSRLSGVCSNQLSYEPRYGGGNRVRTDDPLLAGQVLYQLSYTPISYKSPLLQNKCPLL